MWYVGAVVDKVYTATAQVSLLLSMPGHAHVAAMLLLIVAPAPVTAAGELLEQQICCRALELCEL